MKLPPWFPVAAILCLVLGVTLYGRSQRSLGRNEGRLEASVARNDTLALKVKERDTLYVRDTVRLRYARVKYDSVRVTDTLNVPVRDRPESVVVYIPRAAADTAVAICLRTLSSCDASLRARDSLIYGLRAQVKLTEKAKPSRIGRILHDALILGAGYGLGRVTGR